MKKYSGSNLIVFLIMLSIAVFFIKIYSEEKNKIIIKPKQIKYSIYKNKKYMVDYMKKVNYRMYPELASLIYSSIIRASREHNVDPVMLFSIINQESRFNPWAVSEANCIGLGQVHWNIWGKELLGKGIIREKIDLYNPSANLMCSAYIYSEYFKKAIKKKKKYPHRYALIRYFGLMKSGEKSGYDEKVFKKRKAYIKYVKSRRKGEKR